MHPHPERANADRAKHALSIPGVKDVGVAVGLEKPHLASGLELEEREGRGKSAFDFGLAAKFGDDGAVG